MIEKWSSALLSFLCNNEAVLPQKQAESPVGLAPASEWVRPAAQRGTGCESVEETWNET